MLIYIVKMYYNQNILYRHQLFPKSSFFNYNFLNCEDYFLFSINIGSFLVELFMHLPQ